MARIGKSTGGAVKKTEGKHGAKGRKPRSAAGADRQQKIQTALFEIADAASAVTDMPSFYKRLHEIVGTLMYAGNFFIAVYDEKSGLLSWPYFVDEVEETPPAQPLAEFHGMTSWMIRTGMTARHGKWDLSTDLLAKGEVSFPDVGAFNEDGMGVPLKADGKTIGVVMAQSYTKGIEYTDEDEQVLEFVAQHIAIALTRARAIEETRQRNSELAIINSVQAALAAQLDIHGIYEAVGEKLREIFNYQDVTIYTGDLRSRKVTFEYSYVRGEKNERQSVPMNSLYEYFITSNRTFVFNGGIPSFAAKFNDYENPEPPKSLLAVPVHRIKDTEPIVYLTIQDWDGKKFFSDSDVRLMETLASSMSVALENARLFDEVQKRNREITEALEQQTATSEILSVIASSPTDVQPVFDAIVNRAVELCSGFAGYAYRVVDEKIHLAAQSTAAKNYFPEDYEELSKYFPIPLDTPESESNIAPVIRNCTMFHVTDLKTDPRVTAINREKSIEGDTGAALCIPLIKNEKGVGAIYVEKNEAVPFTEKQIALVNTFADQAVIAIENVRLFTETQRLLKETEDRAAELAVINSAQMALASKLDFQGIVDAVGDKVCEIFPGQGVNIGLADRTRNLMRFLYSFEKGKRYPNSEFPIGQGLSSIVLNTRKPLVINSDTAQKSAELGAIYPTEQVDPASWLGDPITIGEISLGVIVLEDWAREDAFPESTVRLVQTLAFSMGVALENARLFDETQRLLKETEDRAAELAIINSVQAGLASKLDMQSIYDLVGDKIMEIFKADVVGIGLYNHEFGMMHYLYLMDHGKRYFPKPTSVSEKLLNYMKNSGVTLVHTYEQATQLMAEWGIENVGGPVQDNSYIALPLIIRSQFTGRITVAKLPAHAFNESDVRLLQTLANSMSVALENARLFDETQRLLKETEQRAHELATVNTVSAALVRELDLNTLVELVGEQVRSVFKADIAFVALLDREHDIINFPYQYGQHLEPIRLGEGLTSRIIQSEQPLLINEDMDRQRRQMGVSLIGTRAQSFLGVPIFVGGEAIGVVSVQSTKEEGLFSENDQHLLSTIAANVGIAFQNARLFNETQRLFKAEQQAHEQAETLRVVAQALNQSLSLAEVFNLVLTEIQKGIPYDSAGIYEVHDDHRIFVAGRGFVNLEELIGIRFEFNQQDDEIGYLISKSLQPLILEDAPREYPQYFNTGTHAATRIRSYMAVPIVLNQKLIGMITLDKEEPGFYTEQHAKLATAFAAQAATAIHNALLFDETQRLLKESEDRAAELAVINSVQEGLASKLDMQEIYELVGSKIQEIFVAQGVIIATFDYASEKIIYNYYIKDQRYYPEPKPFTVLVHQLIEKRQTILINHDVEGESGRKFEMHLAAGEPARSLVLVPLLIANTAIGYIGLHNLEREDAFTESDVHLLEILANSMSVALENARLWEQEKLYRKALQRELEIGREIQAGFLPDALPQVAGWEIAASLMSAREVAGDFYDAFELPDGNIGLVVADVCDKGVGAALFMTLFRSLIRAGAALDFYGHADEFSKTGSAAETLKRAASLTNNYIAKTHEKSGMFATIFFGILDPHSGRLVYINGGHEPPFVLHDGAVSKTLAKTGPAMGMIPNYDFQITETNLLPGDVFFAYTDGVPDCTNPQGEFYGHDQLHTFLLQTTDSALVLVNCLETKLREYIAGSTQFDDITLLAVKRHVLSQPD